MPRGGKPKSPGSPRTQQRRQLWRLKRQARRLREAEGTSNPTGRPKKAQQGLLLRLTEAQTSGKRGTTQTLPPCTSSQGSGTTAGIQGCVICLDQWARPASRLKFTPCCATRLHSSCFATQLVHDRTLPNGKQLANSKACPVCRTHIGGLRNLLQRAPSKAEQREYKRLMPVACVAAI